MRTALIALALLAPPLGLGEPPAAPSPSTPPPPAAPSAAPDTPAPGPSGVPAPERVDFRMEYRAGTMQRYWLAFDSISNNTDSATPQTALRTRTQEQLTLSFRCIGVEGNGAGVFEIEFDSIKVDLRGGGLDVFYDTDRAVELDAQSPIGPSLRPLAGSRFIVHVDPARNITRITMPDEAQITASDPRTEAFVKEENLRTKFALVFNPEGTTRPLRVGETWTTTKSVAQDTLKLRIKDSHEFRGVKDAIAEIWSTGTVEPDYAANEPGARMVSVPSSLRRSRTIWDHERGSLYQHEHEQKLTVEINVGPKSARSETTNRIKVTRLFPGNPLSPPPESTATPLDADQVPPGSIPLVLPTGPPK